ncbi:FUN14 domain-containing protein 1-like, partial [Physella acuta]|uniref:FUN14 domain-containing protein 1-like n=1 Tax=Physella acuta TaxID=109671 RepID=UPI0027DC06D5
FTVSNLTASPSPTESPQISSRNASGLLKLIQNVEGSSSSSESIVGELNIPDDYIIVEAKPKSSLDVTFERIFGDITKSSALKQVCVGGATGWVTGYMAAKVGKIAAISIAGSLVIIQVAQYNGLLTVNWTKVQHALTKARAMARQKMLQHQTGVTQKVKIFYEENFFLALGFTAGFLLGIVL